MRTRTLLLLATTLTAATFAGVALAGGAGRGPGGAAAAERRAGAGVLAPSAVARASRILGTWDDARASAWAHGDVRALAALYTRSSVTGARDVAELRRWRERGLRVVGLRQQVVALHVLVARPRRLVVRATDRTIDAVAVDGHRRTALPSSTWRGHRIRLLARGGRWVVDEAVAQPAR